MSIHLLADGGQWAVWTDCQPGHRESGRCIGTGLTAGAAIVDAYTEACRDLVELVELAEEFGVFAQLGAAKTT